MNPAFVLCVINVLVIKAFVSFFFCVSCVRVLNSLAVVLQVLEDIIKWFWRLPWRIEWVNTINILCDREFSCISGALESEVILQANYIATEI